jgi:hypothetical protein
MDPEILKYVDEFAKKNGISRAGAISVMVSQYKQSMDGMKMLTELTAAMKKEQDKKQLEDLSE